MTQPKLEPAAYILTLLKQNGSTYNLYLLDGRQFKNEIERFAIIDALVQNGSIQRVQGGIGQTYRLTDKGEKHLYYLCFQKVLRHLADHADTFQQVSDILKELSIPDPNDELADAIDLKLRRGKLVLATEESGVMINENGRHLLVEQKFAMNEQNQEKIQNTITNYVYGNNNSTNTAAGSNFEQTINNSIIKPEDETKMKSYGVTEFEIDELKKIIEDNHKDKPTLVGKTMKWFGGIAASVAAKGLSEHIPAITDFVHKLIS